MSIRKRLTISYIAMFLIPIAVLVLITLFSRTIVKNTIKNTYNVGFNGLPVENIIENDSLIIDKIEDYIKTNDNIDNNYLNKQNAYLNGQTGIVIRENNKIIYMSSFLKGKISSNNLPKFGLNIANSKRHYTNENSFMLLRQYDFIKTRNKNNVSIFLFLNKASAEGIISKFFLIEIGSLAVVSTITALFLTFITSKSIIKPLEELKNSAILIRNGNLDFRLSTNRNDEIGELGIAFEEMRTRLKKSLEIQMQYENNRKELISNISHDLKTPVTAIKGYIEGIRDGVADNKEKMDKYINTIYRKTIDLDKLIDELFLFSKLDLNRVPFRFEKVDILNYLLDCIEELRFELDKRNITIALEANVFERIYVKADREKLKRVIMNIVQNSVKYMNREKGEIKVRVRENNEFCVIEFSDNGIGIDKEALPYVFDRFYRADLSRNSKTGGSGLGLAISRRIIEGHGGKIYAESDGKNGTSIIFKLKKCEDDVAFIRSGNVEENIDN